MTTELKEALATHKAEIISLLQEAGIEQLHFVLKDGAVLGEMLAEKCLVDGCSEKVKFYYFDGIGYGYCCRCDVHQRVVIKPM